MSECAARRCGQQAQAVICTDCRDDLVDNLLDFGSGYPERMGRLEWRKVDGKVEPVDKRVVIPEDDKGRPRRSEAYIPADLVARAGLYADLVDTLTRLDHTGSHSIGKVSGESESAVPYQAAASTLLHTVDNTITTWARDFAETYKHVTLTARSTVEAAEWLALFPDLLAMHPAAGEMCNDIAGLVKRVEKMIDRAPDRVYLGRCGAIIEETGEACQADIYALLGKRFAACRDCGATLDVERRRDELLHKVRDQLATAVDISRGIPNLLERSISADTIRWWAHIGKLTKHKPHPLDGRKRPRYRVGDVIDLAVNPDVPDRPRGEKAS